MSTSTTMTANTPQTIPEKLSDHEARLRALETNASAPCLPTKLWWMSKGVMGPLASGVATVGLVVGDIVGWPGRLLKANAGFEMTPTAQRLVTAAVVV